MIRKLKPDDRAQLETMLVGISQFKQVECDIALELIDAALIRPEQEDYLIYVYEDNSSGCQKILGYHCTGQRPLTDGVFDLYWIAVDPSTQGKGIGALLLKHAEDLTKERKGRWLLAETSSRDDYKATREFYIKNGYSVVANIKDFYSLKDDLVIFGKYFQ